MPRRKKEDEVLAGDRVPRGAANARERTRMRVLSKAFGRLKLTLPWVPPDTKLSKLDTLRLATLYISHLQTILTDERSEASGEVDPEATKNGDAEARRDKRASISLRCWPYGHSRLLTAAASIGLQPSVVLSQAQKDDTCEALAHDAAEYAHYGHVDDAHAFYAAYHDDHMHGCMEPGDKNGGQSYDFQEAHIVETTHL